MLAALSRRSRAPARGAPEQIQCSVTVRFRVLAAQRSLLLADARSELHIPTLVLSALRAPAVCMHRRGSAPTCLIKIDQE